MTDLAHTSVPGWALPGPAGAAEPAETAGDVVAELSGVRLAGPADDVATRLVNALAHAHVGVRLTLTGPAGGCLTVRAAALRAGLEDDELTVTATGPGVIDLYCSHCRETSRVEAGIADVVPCPVCDRSLLVYHHVSRRRGAYLGFQVDAETLPPAAAQAPCQEVAP